jgi:hypothetical protein
MLAGQPFPDPNLTFDVQLNCINRQSSLTVLILSSTLIHKQAFTVFPLIFTTAAAAAPVYTAFLAAVASLCWASSCSQCLAYDLNTANDSNIPLDFKVRGHFNQQEIW